MAVTFIEKVIKYGQFIEKDNNVTIPAPVKVELTAYMFDYADITANEFDALDITANDFDYWLP